MKESERNPLKTHTRGTGQLILEALESGARKIYVGLGGSATNDGGCGIAATFGFRFLDASGNSLAPTGENLQKIQRIIPPNDLSVLKDVEIIAVNDVSNPLSGPEGAAFVYARQKGASVQEIQLLDDGLRHLDKVVAEQLGIEASDMPGAGAAGGAAYGLHCFLNARFISGTDYVLGINGVDEHLRENPVDYVITGEGRIDDQTLHGKLIQGVLELAVRHEVPVLAVCGVSEIPEEVLKKAGFLDVISISDATRSLAFNMSQAARLTREAVGRYFLNRQHI